jgi:ABC-type multidrug transport system ATPase subunit
MEELFRIENLSKSFGNKTVLQNINLKIIRGEIFAFMG